MNHIEQLYEHFPSAADACLILSPQNRRYFTGFPSSAGVLFITKEQAYFLVDFRYIEKAVKKIDNCQVVLLTNQKAQLSELCRKHNVKVVAIESARMTVEEADSYARMLEPVKLDKSPELSKAIERLRMIKTPEELARIDEAQKLTDDAFSYILNFIKPGKTEREIALEMEFFIRRMGADGPSFDFIVVSGANSSMPHGVPGEKPVEKGDFVTMDFGAVVDGYHSDMTRTVAVGSVTEEQEQVYHTVLQAQRLALNLIKPGEICKNIDAAARLFIYGRGYEGKFGHGLGHSVGLDIHEPPVFNTSCEEVIEPGEIYTVEPGIYLEGRFGVRIEDMVVVTGTGIRNFTESEKNLIIL